MPHKKEEMEILAWFGKMDTETGSLIPSEDLNKMEEALKQLPACSTPEQQPDLRALAKASGFIKSDADYNHLLRKVAMGLVRKKLEALATRENDLLQAVEAFDDLNQAVNLLDERLYEWSRLHRDEIVHGKDLAASLSKDVIMGELARTLLGLRESRGRLEAEVISVTTRIAPNLSSLAGPILAARLISRAGGLKRLSEMPSSTIQLMGAEKSLFKHLKGKAPSPKHGLIYRHPDVIGAPKKLRGKAARAVAGKLAIAARMDYHGSGLSSELMDTMEKRLIEIRRSGKAKSINA